MREVSQLLYRENVMDFCSIFNASLCLINNYVVVKYFLAAKPDIEIS